MSNLSQYELYWPPSRSLCQADVAAALDVAGSRGYLVRFPAKITTAGGENVSVATCEDIAQRISVDGGLVDLSSADNNIVFSVSKAKGRISFGTLFELRPDRDELVAADLESMFVSLCEHLRPHFGQVADEWGFEDFLWRKNGDFSKDYRRYVDNIAGSLPPPFLFWLSYFGKEYFAQLDQKALNDISGARLKPCGEGTLIYLGSTPWSGSDAVFRDGAFYRQ